MHYGYYITYLHYDIYYKWQLFLMTLMDRASESLTRKNNSLPAHRHRLHAHRFESLDLPFLPADRSDFDVHGALLDDKVHKYIILYYATIILFKLVSLLYILYLLYKICTLSLQLKQINNGMMICIISEVFSIVFLV
jgi:hypothetical protein